MSSCCEKKTCDLEKLSNTQARTLWIVLTINVLMFFIEIGSGVYAGSLALVSDSMDMLGDALAYGSSLYVIKMGMRAKARSAVFKGWIIVGSGLFILISGIYKTINPETPHFHLMGYVGVLALLSNAICLALLTRFRKNDINMAAVWLCSRNDIIANILVLIAAILVYWTNSPWPDLIVGVGLAVLFFRSAYTIFTGAAKVSASSPST